MVLVFRTLKYIKGLIFMLEVVEDQRLIVKYR